MSSRSSARLAIALILGCILGSAIVPLMLATLEITWTVAAASLSILIVMETLLAIVTARIARACSDDQRYALLKFFLGIQFIVMVMYLVGAVFLGNRFLLLFSSSAVVILIPALILLLKFKGLLIERGLCDSRKVRATQLVSAVATIVFAAVVILFGSKLDILILDALRLVLAFVAAPIAIVTIHEGLVLLRGLWVEALQVGDRP